MKNLMMHLVSVSKKWIFMLTTIAMLGGAGADEAIAQGTSKEPFYLPPILGVPLGSYTASPYLYSAYRVQQVIDSSALKGQWMITGFKVASSKGGGPMGKTVFEVRMSTTDKKVDGLDVKFANNVGADETIVVPKHEQIPAGLEAIFSVPFYYDSTKGNLLVDFISFEGGSEAPGTELVWPEFSGGAKSLNDVSSSLVPTSLDDMSIGGNTSAAIDYEFLVTPVPEPGIGGLAGVAALGAAAALRRKS